ncbi:enoyl-CoA hydratase [Anopheles sinensis]|uniref:Enoyl-CoA hydratase n=1 Tax=Anopheles sinensis TaxID=74873 RepID=A0A084WTK8_ANOSI|nr:enoyl-CoA hydratase [Anopheles sinensis]
MITAVLAAVVGTVEQHTDEVALWISAGFDRASIVPATNVQSHGDGSNNGNSGSQLEVAFQPFLLNHEELRFWTPQSDTATHSK